MRSIMRPGKAVVLVIAALVVVTLFPTLSRADQWDRKTKLTFSQPVEIPGRVLPAGTYTFKLHNIPSNRNIVQISDEDDMKVIALILAIPNYRLTPTGETVLNFAERPSNTPQAVKAWFYPGENFGHEFAYPKQRAMQLAVAENEAVPALTVEPTPRTIETTPLIAVTPEQKEAPVEEAFQTTPAPARQAAPMVAQAELPKTASLLPLVALLGFLFISVGFALMLVLRLIGGKA